METIIQRKGNYRDLICYRKAETIYDITYLFANNFLKSSDRTIDQMIQAARSGKQNIVEGCMASATSTKTEIKLLNVAKASLQELLEDYEDYLKTRGHRQWEDDSEELRVMRELGRQHSEADYFMKIAQTRPAETIANMAIVLLKQADYLLHRQIQRLADDFTRQGGFSERMTRARISSRAGTGSVINNTPKDLKDSKDLKGPITP